MAELADAADSKSADLRVMGVRPPLPAPISSLHDSSMPFHAFVAECWAQKRPNLVYIVHRRGRRTMSFDLVKMTGVLERVKTPLTLGGLALLIFYGIFSKVLALGIWGPLQEGSTAALIGRVLFYTFILALICVVLGVTSFLAVRFVRPAKAR